MIVKIEANHKGYFQFKLCNLDKFNNVESDECYDDIVVKLPNGDDKHTIVQGLGDHEVTLQLPSGVVCKHCVLQWTYVTGMLLFLSLQFFVLFFYSLTF